MLVSIITITYNSEKTLEQTLLSVTAQTYPQIEHIIVDGASTDGTQQIIERYKSKIATYISEPDSGIYEAINKGIALAKGDVIGILNSDDVFAEPDTIAHIVKAFETQPADVVYGDLEYCNMERQAHKQLVRYWKSNVFKRADLKYGWMPPHPTLYCKREVFDKYGLYNIKFRISGDYDFMMRIFNQATLRTAYIPKVLVKMRIGGISNRNLQSIIQKMCEDYQVMRNNGLSLFTLVCKNIRKITQWIS